MSKMAIHKDWGPKIRQAREARNWSQQKLAEVAGTNQPTIDRLEAGQTKNSKYLESVLLALELKKVTLLSDEPIPLVGYVGAGSEGHYYADGDDLNEFVKMPRNGTATTVALEIRGTSLGPAFNGWLVFYDSEKRFAPIEAVLRKLCVVETSDNRRLVKMPYPSSIHGLYNLHSNGNDPIIENVEITWAALVTDISPR